MRSVAYEDTWDATYGLEIQEATDSLARGRVPSIEPMLDPRSGVVNGGLYASVAETLASYATTIGVHAAGRIATGMYNSTHVARFMTEGEVNAVARVRSRADDEWLWDVEMTDGAGEICAFSTVCIAVRSNSPQS